MRQQVTLDCTSHGLLPRLALLCLDLVGHAHGCVSKCAPVSESDRCGLGKAAFARVQAGGLASLADEAKEEIIIG